MAKKLLAYNISTPRYLSLKAVCAAFDVELIKVTPNLYSASIGFVADIAGIDRKPKVNDKSAIESEMLVFSGLTPDELDKFLGFMKTKNLSIPLKAIVTMYNVSWSGSALYSELKKEYGKL